MKQPGTASAAGEHEILTPTAGEGHGKNQALNDYFKDGDDEIFHAVMFNDHEDVSLSTATRDKKTTTLNNYATVNQRGLEMFSNNASSKQSTYFDRYPKVIESGTRINSAKDQGDQPGRTLSQSTSANKTRPQTSYHSYQNKFPTKKPYFVRFQQRREARGNIQRDPSLKFSNTQAVGFNVSLGGTQPQQ